MTTVVIVGTGIAGATAALTLRADGFDGRVVLLGAEPAEPYRRPPLTKDVLRGTMPAERTRLRPSATWADRGIELRTGTDAVELRVEDRTVALGDGSLLGYDRLLLATGGRSRTIAGTAGLPGVHTVRGLVDVAALRADLAATDSLLVIGAGLIGAEVAASARATGLSVTVLEAAAAPMERLLPPSIAAVFAGLHRAHGVELHTGVTLDRLESAGGEVRAVGRDGRSWTAGAAVVAVGMAPNTELAERAGLAVANGIVVDEFCATSAPDVFAAGDVANQPNLVLGGRHRVEHWQGAQEHGAAAARSILGAGAPFDRVPWCWSEQYGVNLQVCGWPAADDEVVVRGTLGSHDCTALLRRGGRLVGAVGVNRPAEVQAARRLIAEAPDVDPGVFADPATDLTALAANRAG